MDSIKKNLLVSIITPTYNRASFIEETINSILNQDYKNIEYIIIDDGSTDNTQEILNKYKDKVIIYSQKNRGEAAAVNKGFSLAKGEIIGVINSDDPIYRDAVSKIIEYFLKFKDIPIIYPIIKAIKDDNLVDYAAKLNFEIIVKYFNKDIIKEKVNSMYGEIESIIKK